MSTKFLFVAESDWETEEEEDDVESVIQVGRSIRTGTYGLFPSDLIWILVGTECSVFQQVPVAVGYDLLLRYRTPSRRRTRGSRKMLCADRRRQEQQSRESIASSPFAACPGSLRREISCSPTPRSRPSDEWPDVVQRRRAPSPPQLSESGLRIETVPPSRAMMPLASAVGPAISALRTEPRRESSTDWLKKYMGVGVELLSAFRASTSICSLRSPSLIWVLYSIRRYVYTYLIIQAPCHNVIF